MFEKDAKILVRNIAPDIWAGLQALAAKHERSNEAEARYAIRTWVEQSAVQESRGLHNKQVAERLNWLIDHMSIVTNSKIKVSHVAESIGEQYVSDAEKWFLGELEPSLSKLTLIAEHFGASAKWLQHGDYSPFEVRYKRLEENLEADIAWLYNRNETRKPVSLAFLREDDKTGALIIVKKYDEVHYEVFRTPYHISSEVGNSGAASLAYLTVLFEFIYKKSSPVVASSYSTPKENWMALLDGKLHASIAIKSSDRQLWIEDIWDLEMFSKTKKSGYWTGWHELCDTVYRHVKATPRLQKTRDQIQSGELPLLRERTE